MGMIGNLMRVKQAELEAYLEDSSLLENKIYNDADGDQKNDVVDLDKAWAGILFLLTGQGLDDLDHPLASVLFSGQFIDEHQDLGYGPAQYLTAQQAAELSDALSKITESELRENFDAEKMTTLEIYPSIWDEGEEAFSYLLHYFKDMQKVFSEAKANNEALITFIS